MNRFAAVVVLLAIAACSQSDHSAGGTGKLANDALGAQPAAARAAFTETRARRIKHAGTFASLPDRGELLAYLDPDATKHEGAYTWHRAGVSEAYALRAIVERKLRVMTPSGEVLDIEYDHHIEHDSGDWSWVGHLPGDPGAQTILTFGVEAVFGSIAQTGKRSLRLTSRDGAAWLVETDPTKLAGLASAAANPTKPDHLAVPKQLLAGRAKVSSAQRQAAPATVAAAAAAATTIDVLVGYTGGIASRPGGASAALTRINNLVTLTNEAYANSQVNAQLRLVHAMQVNYTDASTNESTLEQLTGYDVSDQQFTTPNAAFNALRSAREQYGADLVVLLRAFRDPQQDGCGVAWLIGGGKDSSTIGAQDYFGYSVVGDGQDVNEQDGKTYFCREESFAHELGHNMGSAHDRAAAMGGDGVLDDPDDYGAFAYSFGYKTGAAAGNFYTIMAYGDAGQQDYRVFSNPRTAICGNRACGTVNDDNARSLGQTIPAVATFRASSYTFSDVPGSHWAYAPIEHIYNLGITGGCNASPPLYCPGQNVLREEMAIFVLRAKHGGSYQPPAPTGIFADVPTSYWAIRWIERAYNEGIASGCSSNPRKFCPRSVVARDQMAIMLLRAKHGASYQPPPATGMFTDVPTTYWAAAWIEQLTREGVTGGCSTTPRKFCPSSPVTRDQMAVFLVRNFDL